MDWSDIGINVQLRSGKKLHTLPCPECSPGRTKKKDPCLTINNEEGNRWYKCNHCGWKGSLELDERFEKVKANAWQPRGIADIYPASLTNLYADKGISVSTLQYMGVYAATKHGELYACFPFYWSKTLVNVKFRPVGNTTGKARFHQISKNDGSASCFFGMQHLKLDKSEDRVKPNVITIVEGESDYATQYQAKIKNILSVPQGAPAETATNFEHEFDYLKDEYFVKNVLPYVDQFVLCADDDKSGNILKNELAKRLGKHRCKYMKYPVGYKDSNEVAYGDKNKELKALGIDELVACHTHAEPFPVNGIIKIGDIMEEIHDLRIKGWQRGVLTGNSGIDSLISWKRKLSIYLTGVPYSGKSTWLRYYLVKLVKNNPTLDLKFALFTPENRPVSREFAMIIEIYTGKTFKKGLAYSLTEVEIENASRWVGEHFFIINPSRFSFESFGNKNLTKEVSGTLESILGYVKFLKQEYGVFGWVIDAFNKIEWTQTPYTTAEQYISRKLDEIHEFNSVYNVGCVVVAHPTKMEKSWPGGNFKIPSLYDIKGSSAWAEKADIGISIHREFMQNTGEKDPNSTKNNTYFRDNKAPTLLTCEKMKFDELGQAGERWSTLSFEGGYEFNPCDINSYRQKAAERYLQKDNEKRIVDKQLDAFSSDDDESLDLPF